MRRETTTDSLGHKRVQGLVSLVIPNWNGKGILPDCLDALRSQTYSQIEVIVVDNASTDGSSDLVKLKYPEAMLIPLSENRGFAGGVNEGIRSARGEFIGLLNNDAVARPDWIQRSLRVLQSDDSIAAVAAKLLRRSESRVRRIDSTGNSYSTWGISFPRGRDEIDRSQFDDQVDVFAISGGAALVRADLFDSVGLFDPEFFMYLEDVDISFRARLAGRKIKYVPEAIVIHEVSASSGGGYNAKVRYHSVKNAWYVYLKNMPGRLLWQYLPLFLVSQILLLASSIIRGLTIAHLKGLFRVATQMPRTLRMRRSIQRQTRIGAKDLDRMQARELPPPYKSELARIFRKIRKN